MKEVKMRQMQKQSIFYNQLLCYADEEYKAFTSKLVPNVKPEKIIGVRIPQLRKMAKDLMKQSKDDPSNITTFMITLPHEYFDENNLHGLILNEEKDFDKTISSLELFLPHVDNWASCDIISPKSFKPHKAQLLPHIRRWMDSNHEYTVRFGIEMLMTHFLNEDFRKEYLQWVVAVQQNREVAEKYYVKMMIAWFFATALTKQYKDTLPVLEQELLEPWTHNMAIQKARESRQISLEVKEYLKTLKKK